MQVVPVDVRELHRDPCHRGALFQVASQFNMLEMVHEGITPEDGVGCYERDPTQGPACAIAAGAATVYRNCLVLVDGQSGQTRERQLDGLADLGRALSEAIGRPVGDLCELRNGDAMCTAGGLAAIETHLGRADEPARDALRALLRIGLHLEVEVTDVARRPGPRVSQAFCSALPIAYTSIPRPRWERFARLVLEAAYEATLLAGLANARRTGSPTVVLTRLGGGAFGNDPCWIDDAIGRALAQVADRRLDVRIVVRGEPPPALRRLERDHPVEDSVPGQPVRRSPSR